MDPQPDAATTAATPCTHVSRDALEPADPTPGMSRQVALSTGAMWSGTVDTEAGAVSGWHHHGDHDTTLYVVSGRMRLESGPDGRHVVEAGPGDFLRVPAGAVHRESNPGGETSRAVIVRCGSGTPTVNVDGPAAAAPDSPATPAPPGQGA
ncbi:cupin domain-containing protein [Terrabacter sp. NPDC000476]|uniref:cupin domain-containing protein n=1 Tax=Terrabacter sp. NPDC000476 TaxID=3154258 RepID=UPI00331EFABC